jgi:hypothetical protein
MLLEMEYLYPLLPNLEAFFLIHQFRVYLKVDIAPPLIRMHVTDKQFLTMWKIGHLEWREYLTYNIISCYI